MKIQPGPMRHSITIQSPSGTPGPLGQVQWVTFAQARAELIDGNGRELTAPETGGSDANVEIRLRYLPGVKAEMRVIVNGDYSRRFVVKYITIDTPGQPRLLHLYCREIMAATPENFQQAAPSYLLIDETHLLMIDDTHFLEI